MALRYGELQFPWKFHLEKTINSIVDLREKKLQKQNSIVQHFYLFDVKLY